MTDLELLDTVIAPAFASVDADVKTEFITFAENEMSAAAWGQNFQRGKLLLAAHMMQVTPGILGAGSGSGSDGSAAGPVRRKKAGDLEIEYAVSANQSGTGQSGSSDDALKFTSYGREYLRLRASQVIPAAVHDPLYRLTLT